MTVADLKEYLCNLDDSCQVYVVSIHSHNSMSPLLSVSGNHAYVMLRDHNVVREDRIVRAYDGTEYEVPWP